MNVLPRRSTDIDAAAAATVTSPGDERVAAGRRRIGRTATSQRDNDPADIGRLSLPLVVGLLLTIVCGVLCIDAFGPTSARAGVIVDRYEERGRRSTSHHLVGTDDQGGAFDTTVAREAHDRAGRGDEVTVHRSALTGRVVAIDGEGWSSGAGSRQIAAGVMLAVGVGFVVGGWIAARRARPRVTADVVRRERRIVVCAALVTLVGTAVWIGSERSAAAGDGAAAGKAAAAAESGDPCDADAVGVRSLVGALLVDGRWSSTDHATATAMVTVSAPGCNASAVVCAIVDASASGIPMGIPTGVPTGIAVPGAPSSMFDDHGPC